VEPPAAEGHWNKTPATGVWGESERWTFFAIFKQKCRILSDAISANIVILK